MKIMTVSQLGPQWASVASASFPTHCHSLRAFVRPARSGDSRAAGPPASCRRRCCCRQSARRGHASSAAAVAAGAHRSVPRPRSAPRAPGRCCRGAAASTSAGWRASGAHRGTVWCLRSGARRATGEDMSRRCSLGWAIGRRCPVGL
jgi:hypothetical protein